MLITSLRLFVHTHQPDCANWTNSRLVFNKAVLSTLRDLDLEDIYGLASGELVKPVVEGLG